MRLIIKAYNIAIDMDENVVEVIVVENPRVFYEIISNTMRDFENDNKLLFIEDDGRALGNSKYEIVPSPFSINLNNKKMLNAVYKDSFLDAYFSSSRRFSRRGNGSLATQLFCSSGSLYFPGSPSK